MTFYFCNIRKKIHKSEAQATNHLKNFQAPNHLKFAIWQDELHQSLRMSWTALRFVSHGYFSELQKVNLKI